MNRCNEEGWHGVLEVDGLIPDGPGCDRLQAREVVNEDQICLAFGSIKEARRALVAVI